jgi:hypothetical protein
MIQVGENDEFSKVIQEYAFQAGYTWAGRRDPALYHPTLVDPHERRGLCLIFDSEEKVITWRIGGPNPPFEEIPPLNGNIFLTEKRHFIDANEQYLLEYCPKEREVFLASVSEQNLRAYGPWDLEEVHRLLDIWEKLKPKGEKPQTPSFSVCASTPKVEKVLLSLAEKKGLLWQSGVKPTRYSPTLSSIVTTPYFLFVRGRLAYAEYGRGGGGVDEPNVPLEVAIEYLAEDPSPNPPSEFWRSFPVSYSPEERKFSVGCQQFPEDLLERARNFLKEFGPKNH